MASLDGQNRTGGGEENGTGKEVDSSKVRGDTDVFHETSDAGHGRDVGQNAREVERASSNRCASKGLDARLGQGNTRVRSNRGN